MKLIHFTLFILTPSVFAQSVVSYYDAEFAGTDLSGFGASGGSFDITYNLRSGNVDPGLGASFDVTYNLSALSNGYKWAAPVGTDNDIRFTIGGGWQADTTTSATLSYSNLPVAPTDWTKIEDNFGLSRFNFTNPDPDSYEFHETNDFTQIGQVLARHETDTVYEVTVNGGNGTGVTGANFRMIQTIGTQPNQYSHFAFEKATPEPSSTLLGLVGLSFLGCRRRR